MSAQAAFQRGVSPLMHLLLAGKEDEVLTAKPDEELQERIEVLAERCSEGELSAEERAEYEGYVRANKFVAILQMEARYLKGLVKFSGPRSGGRGARNSFRNVSPKEDGVDLG